MLALHSNQGFNLRTRFYLGLTLTACVGFGCSDAVTTFDADGGAAQDVAEDGPLLDASLLDVPTVAQLPLATIGDFNYVGGFRLPTGDYGDGNINNTDAVIEVTNGSLFISGHPQRDTIAEFAMPIFVDSTELSDMNTAATPVQPFVRVLARGTTGNPQQIDMMTGMRMIDGKLVVNAHTYYDGDSNNTHTTLIIQNPADLAGSAVDGYYELPGGARSGGWISPVPLNMANEIGGDLIVGYSSVTAITSRHSVGPSAFAVNAEDILGANTLNPQIEATELMMFPADAPLASDWFNESRTNDLWTHMSGARYGFIIPGTRTYAALGGSAGHVSGVGYKVVQANSGITTECGGYCPNDYNDSYSYYWLFDVNDLLDVKAGRLAGSAVRPYEYGVFPVPTEEGGLGGGSFDVESGTLYVALRNADTENRYVSAPVIAAYRFPVFD